jgi:hypothetical protein
VDQTAAEDQYREFIGDAACVLDVNQELHEAAPALIEEPFNPVVQKRLMDLLSSERQSRANAAAVRLAHPRPLGRI